MRTWAFPDIERIGANVRVGHEQQEPNEPQHPGDEHEKRQGRARGLFFLMQRPRCIGFDLRELFGRKAVHRPVERLLAVEAGEQASHVPCSKEGALFLAMSERISCIETIGTYRTDKRMPLKNIPTVPNSVAQSQKVP